jgi:long-chain acyl-CoA synthetase
MRPTFMAVIPQFFGFFSARISAAMEEYSMTSKHLFFQALESKKAALKAEASYTNSVYDRMMFSEVRALIGGNIRVILTIGDWIDPLPLEFMRCTLCCPVILAYGTTETGLVTVTQKDDLTPGSLGSPLPGLEIRLLPIKSLGMEGANGQPGEISVRWNENEWLDTGDIGSWTRRGNLRFIDRVEYCEKNEEEELLTLGMLSHCYTRNQWVNQIYVYQDAAVMRLAAVVVPDLWELTNYAAGMKNDFGSVLDGEEISPAELLRHAGIKKMVLQSLGNTHRELGLPPHQKIEKIRFQLDPFTLADFLSVSLKQKRGELALVFK